MNFGLFAGFIFGWLLTFVVIYFAVIMFRRSLSYLCYGSGSLYKKGYVFVLSLYFVLVAARFSYSEFTNVMFSFVIMSVIPLTIAYFVLILRLKVRT